MKATAIYVAVVLIALALFPSCAKKSEVAQTPTPVGEASAPGTEAAPAPATAEPAGEPKEAAAPVQGATPEDLGVEFYPGAKVAYSTAAVGGSASGAVANLETPDDYDKVVKFYKDTYGDKSPQVVAWEAEGKQNTSFHWTEDSVVHAVIVMRKKDGDKTEIMVTKTSK